MGEISSDGTSQLLNMQKERPLLPGANDIANQIQERLKIGTDLIMYIARTEITSEGPIPSRQGRTGSPFFATISVAFGSVWMVWWCLHRGRSA